MLITHCRLREARSPGSENIGAARAHSCLLFIIALPVVIKPPGYYYPFRARQQTDIRQDGLGVWSLPGCSKPPKAPAFLRRTNKGLEYEYKSSDQLPES